MVFVRDEDDQDKDGGLHFRLFKDKDKKESENPEDEFRVNTRKSADDNVVDLDTMLNDADAQAQEQGDGN